MKHLEEMSDVVIDGEVTTDSGIWSWWEDGNDDYEEGFYSCFGIGLMAARQRATILGHTKRGQRLS